MGWLTTKGLLRQRPGNIVKLQTSTTRVTILIFFVLALVGTPAVAWALTSPKTTVDFPAQGSQVHGQLTVSGTAEHRVGVGGVRLVLRNLDDGTYFNGDTWQRSFIRFDVPVHSPGQTETQWSFSLSADNLEPGRYRARAFAYSVEGNGDGFGGDLNEFTYLGRFDPALYDTEIVSPTDGGTVSGAIAISGVAQSTEGVESVKVVVRNVGTGRYWNAETAQWQPTFVTVQAELGDSSGVPETTWAVGIPEEHASPGTYFTRAWVRTAEGNGDPIGRGQSTFTVTSSEPPVTTTTIAPSTTSTSERTPSSTTSTSAPTTETTTAPTTTTAETTTSTTTNSRSRQPFGHGDVSWELIASDDFNGTRLDDNMWEYGWWGPVDGSKYDRPVNGNETACYHTDQVTLADGELSLTMRPTTEAEDASGVCRKKDGSKAEFVSGYATTRQRYQVQAGTYLETRMFMPGEGDVLYNWPAFWLADMDRGLGSKWPHSGEFDIAEILRGQACGNYHYATSPGGAHQQIGKRCTTVPANTWAVFGMKWNHDGTVEFFHQGEPVQDRGDGGDWIIDPLELAGPFAIDYTFNIALQHGLHSPERPGYKEPTAANPLSVKFDYVDVYQLPKP